MKFKLDLGYGDGDGGQRLPELASKLAILQATTRTTTRATTTRTVSGMQTSENRQQHVEDKVVRVCLASVKA